MRTESRAHVGIIVLSAKSDKESQRINWKDSLTVRTLKFSYLGKMREERGEISLWLEAIKERCPLFQRGCFIVVWISL